WDPDWRAWVDGQAAPVLRANHLMRAVSVPAGDHRVEFRYQPPRGTLWVNAASLAMVAMACGIALGGIPARHPSLGRP
ncbi:MAG: YfhO family protein, partial [Verrucomicrobiales bacterium]|nr:YfhO family protein [Verrucomicrobiales bacterium]